MRVALGPGGVAYCAMELLQLCLLSLSVVWFCSCVSSSLTVNVSEVSDYTKLRSWKQSTLYRVESDAGYDSNPLLLHLVGSRYGKFNHQ